MQSTSLYANGYLLVKIDDNKIFTGRTLLKNYFKNIPEHVPGIFTPFASKGDIGPGAFGALGLPSSYHNLAKRNLDRMCFDAIEPVLKKLAVKLNLRRIQCVPDRLLYRTKKQPTESFHYDATAKAQPTDVFLGSITNLNVDIDQTFVLVPGTHKHSADPKGGDYTATDPAKLEQYKRDERTIIIRPGYMLVFYENIIHRVSGKKPPKPLLRNFLGFRATNDTVASYAINEALFDCQGALAHKGGSIAPPYPHAWVRNHPHCFIEYNKRLVPEMLEPYTYKSGKKQGMQIIRPKNPQPSLTVLGKRYRDYTSSERDLFRLRRV